MSITAEYYTPQASGRKVVAVTNTAVAITTTEACNVLIIQALPANSANICFGMADALTTAGSERGIALEPGQTAEIKTRAANLWYINGAAGDGVTFLIFG